MICDIVSHRKAGSILQVLLSKLFYGFTPWVDINWTANKRLDQWLTGFWYKEGQEASSTRKEDTSSPRAIMDAGDDGGGRGGLQQRDQITSGALWKHTCLGFLLLQFWQTLGASGGGVQACCKEAPSLLCIHIGLGQGWVGGTVLKRFIQLAPREGAQH